MDWWLLLVVVCCCPDLFLVFVSVLFFSASLGFSWYSCSFSVRIEWDSVRWARRLRTYESIINHRWWKALSKENVCQTIQCRCCTSRNSRFLMSLFLSILLVFFEKKRRCCVQQLSNKKVQPFPQPSEFFSNRKALSWAFDEFDSVWVWNNKEKDQFGRQTFGESNDSYYSCGWLHCSGFLKKGPMECWNPSESDDFCWKICPQMSKSEGLQMWHPKTHP